MEDKNLEALKKFAQFVKERIDDGIKGGTVKKAVVNQEYFKWKVKDFKYTVKDGVSTGTSEGEHFIKSETMFNHNLEEEIKESEEYKSLVKQLEETFKDERLSSKVDFLLRLIVRHYIQTFEIKEDMLNIFLKELKGEPSRTSAIVKVQGLILEPVSITVSNNVTLRQVNITDLEEENPIYPFIGVEQFPNDYSAVLNIETFGHSSLNIQKEVSKAVTILRMFKPGSVRYVKYKIISESITNPTGGTISSGRQISSTTNCRIYSSDVGKLIIFWKILDELLPSSFFWSDTSPANNESIQFAYQRYSDALFSDGTFEQRLVNTIIALESLYLNDSQELSRYLSLRVSKFLGLAGLDPYRIKTVLKEAYKLRSFFVHGNSIPYRLRKKIEAQFESEDKLLYEILDYLRLSIVIMLALKKQKDEMIDTIDDTFIDRKKEDALSGHLKGIMERSGLK